MNKLILAVLLLSFFIISGCRYKAECWSDGQSLYSTGWQRDRNICAKPRGEGWWLIPGYDEPIKADCSCRIK